MRIVRVANFVTERSGGLRTALRQLGIGYQRAGHEAMLIIPGEHASDVETEQGRIITLAGPEVPGMGGYRVLLDRNRTAAVLRKLRPDRIEVSDRTTLRWVGGWARRHGVPSMMVSHESLDGLLRLFGPSSGSRIGSTPGPPRRTTGSCARRVGRRPSSSGSVPATSRAYPLVLILIGSHRRATTLRFEVGGRHAAIF